MWIITMLIGVGLIVSAFHLPVAYGYGAVFLAGVSFYAAVVQLMHLYNPKG